MPSFSEKTFQIQAHAKVNLCLSVQYPPVDGYHELKSVFQTLDLHDTLTFEFVSVVQNSDAMPTKGGTPVLLDCGPLCIPTSENLIFRAVDLVEEACGLPMAASGQMLKITVEKHIPAGGGLGGGSSDAAASLRAYARVRDLDVLDERIVAVARQLGADVAFFLYGGAALMGGRGDVLDRRLPDFLLPLVLMGDNCGCSTPEIYRRFDANPPAAPDAEALACALAAGFADAAELARLCANNLEPAALADAPRLAERLAVANADEDVLRALVTGSGSTSFAICRDAEAAVRFSQRIAPVCDWVHVARPCTGL